MTISKTQNTVSTDRMGIDQLITTLEQTSNKMARIEANLEIMESQLHELRDWFNKQNLDPDKIEEITDRIDLTLSEIEKEANEFLDTVVG